MTPDAGDGGWINLTIQGSASFLALKPVRVRVDGRPVTTVRGRNLIPVPAGLHHVNVQIWIPYIVGQADIEVEVPAGQTVAVWYAAPRSISDGAIGLEPQKHPDSWMYPAMMAMALLVVIGIVVAFVASR
jgi:hypothetical protein